MKKSVWRLLTILVVWLGLLCGSAWGYSSVVGFGDSLTDTGNVARFTDGTVWIESLADHFSANLFNFAYGGATTGYDNPAFSLPITGLLWQVDTALPLVGALPSSDTLYTVWAGANDFLQARSPVDAVANMGAALENLYGEGGREFLVPNLPNIGATPAFFGDPIASQAASDWSQYYNMGLETMLQGFGALHPDINLYAVDAFGIFGQFAVGSPEWLSLFWHDGFHPSAAGHELIFQTAKAAVDPVPEPSTLLLFSAGLMMVVGIKRRVVSRG